jgi:hypothetical protein
MQDDRGTLVTNSDDTQSSRSPSPAEMGEFEDVRTAKGPESRQAIESEARMYGIDPAKYGTDMVGLRSAVVKERPRMRAIAEDYDTVPSTYKYDERTEQFVPDAYKFAPTDSTRQRADNYKAGVQMRQQADAIRDRYGDRLGPESQKQLEYLEQSGDMAALRDFKRGLDNENRVSVSKNISDRNQNTKITSELQSPTRAAGFVYRSLADSSPAQRSALYRVLGWGDAAEAETQAQIAQDAYNTQMAISSQQQPDAVENPDDATIAGQTQRHFNMIDRMIANDPRNGVANAVSAQANFLVTAHGRDPAAAQQEAQATIADRMARNPQYRSNPVVATRMAQMAQQSQDQFVAWAAGVGIPAADASLMYRNLRSKNGDPTVNAWTGR